MKKILIIFSALLLVFSAGAQTKDAVLKNLDKAKTTVENPKKATNVAAWMKLSEAYMNAYSFPQGGVWVGASAAEVKLVLGNQKVVSSEVKNYSGVDYTVDTYEDKALYYNPMGLLEVIQILAPVTDEDCLDGSFNSIMKAYEYDTKHAKTEDLKVMLNTLRTSYINEAMGFYTLGDIKSANKFFEESLKTSDNPVTETVDSMITYYTAVTFNMLGDKANAIKYFEKCREIGYHQNGDVYSSLAELYKAGGDVDKAKELLNIGFQQFPTSQAILVSLINIYLESKDDPNKVLDLIRTAQNNEPANASLYYAEGNVYKNLGDNENAIKCYYKSFEIDPNYVFGIYSVGSTYFDEAIAIQTKMDELDVKDVEGYEKLYGEFEQALLNAAEPFEKAFNATADKEFQISIADGLKQIYFRFRDKDPKYQAGYEKYNKFLIDNQPAPAQ